MKIMFILDSPYAWKSGIWFHRNHVPSIGLKLRGHKIKFVALGGSMSEQIKDWADTVIFGRTYHPSLNAVDVMRDFKSRGKRVLYDIDDDFWTVNPDNPSKSISNAFKDQYESFIRVADAVLTPSHVLKKKIQKLVKNKPVFICDNAIHYDLYPKRDRKIKQLIIGYSGASSHWGDLEVIAEPLIELKRKHDFIFTLQGMTGGPIEGEMYYFNEIVRRRLRPEREDYMKQALKTYSKLREVGMIHVPFYPPELHPTTLSKCDFDIALAPLDDNEFNRGKSCIKFYEYASVGSAVLASDVLPYKDTVSYRAKNTTKDWVEKLERLIVDKKFREELTEKQGNWVKKHKAIEVIALDWEMACQLPGGLKVRSQEKSEEYFKNPFKK